MELPVLCSLMRKDKSCSSLHQLRKVISRADATYKILSCNSYKQLAKLATCNLFSASNSSFYAAPHCQNFVFDRTTRDFCSSSTGSWRACRSARVLYPQITPWEHNTDPKREPTGKLLPTEN